MPRFFNPSRIAPPGSRYSHGVVHSARAHRLLISGQVGVRPDGSVAEGLEAQIEVAWDNLIEVLREGGMGVQDLVKVLTFCTVPARSRSPAASGSVSSETTRRRPRISRSQASPRRSSSSRLRGRR